MKTKLFLSICMLFVLTSCINDYHGGSGEEIKLTEDNYLYEGDLYQIYLDQEIEKLDLEIEVLEDIVANNQANQTTYDELATAKNKKVEFNAEIESIISIEELERRIPSPRPPCPRPSSCDFAIFEYILAGKNVKEIALRILDEDGKTIGGGTIDELSPLPDTKDLIKFSKLNIAPYTGTISIAIEVIDKTGNNRNYIIGGK
ncbi:hypothetical protein [Maribacter sp.]|uniref:hypothetical protein n=1 Tax=Maribacter sp. TaxID=1897614 RepID=UPI0025C2D329|nr:hypothetical protein [Maribacter sp.]